MSAFSFDGLQKLRTDLRIVSLGRSLQSL